MTGDIIFSSGKLGSGNAYAISKLISQTKSFVNYSPVAQIKHCDVISKYASCCMDTSDGFISTIDQLMHLNNVGFEVNQNWLDAIDSSSLEYIKNLSIPTWLLLAGQHGEFELVFTIPMDSKDSFIEEALSEGLKPVELGKVIPEKEIKINLYGELIPINTTLIRNLLTEANGDVEHYLKSLLEYDFQLKNSPKINFTSN